MPLPSIPHMKPPVGTQINPLHPLSRGLIGYWLFNEGSGSRAYDISGHGNHGTLVNMSPNAQNSGWGGSKFGGGLHFNGIDNCVDINPIYIPDNTPWSVIIHVKIDDIAKSRFFGNQFTAGNYSRFFYYAAISEFRLYNDANLYATWSVPLEAHQFQDIILVCDGAPTANINLYINGIDKGTDTLAISSQTIRKIGSIGNTSHVLDGTMDNIRFFYNYALSVPEVKQLHHYPFCNLLRVPVRYVPAAAIMNQFQNFNIGADLYNGAIIA